MSFQIKSDKYELAYANLLRRVREAIQITFAEEEENGLTQAVIADELGVDASVISRRIAGTGNVTLRSISDLYTAMCREPLENFKASQSARCFLSVNAADNGDDYRWEDSGLVCVVNNVTSPVYIKAVFSNNESELTKDVTVIDLVKRYAGGNNNLIKFDCAQRSTRRGGIEIRATEFTNE